MSTDREPKSVPRKYTGLRVALGFAAGMAGLGAAGCATPDGKTVSSETPTPKIVTPAPQPDLTQPQLVPAVSAAEIPTLVPTPKPTEAPATATATATATSTPPPTETPEPTATAPATFTPKPIETPKPTETPKPPEKSPLPIYGAYLGNLLNEKTGAKEGMIVIASIPRTGQPEQILAYYTMNDMSYEALLLDPQKIQGNSFEYTNPNSRDFSAGFYTIKASLDNPSNVLTGIAELRRGRNPVEIRNFKADFVGTGREKVLEAAKKMKTTQGGGKYGNNWTNVRVDELQRTFHINLP